MALALLVGAPVAAHSEPVARADQLPNLVPLPLFDLRIGDADDGPGKAIRFAAAIANRGDYALELFGRPEFAADSTAPAEQCIAWATPRTCTERRSVGRFVWHPEHGHYHFEDFALYELRRLKKNGMPNMKPKGLVQTSEKISFCVMDIEPDGPASSPFYQFQHPLYLTCLAGAGFQGISPGWRDVYGSSTTGQQIPLEGLVPGTYALVSYTDPADRIFETDETDNVSVVGITLSDDLKKITEVCESEPGSLRCEHPPGTAREE